MTKSVGVPPFGDAIAFTQGSVADRPIRRRRALPVDFTSPPHECSVAPTYWGTLPELMEVITHARQEKIKVLVEHFPLQRADEAYQLLHDGRIQGRAVITPPTRECGRRGERPRDAPGGTDVLRSGAGQRRRRLAVTR
ncbi:hypothetical protein [Streptomyces misionensis]|uniref:hypothetical protein n=1 Tax=Streptomyces misionensis TaxID=67331 RepID=UPI003679A552